MQEHVLLQLLLLLQYLLFYFCASLSFLSATSGGVGWGSCDSLFEAHACSIWWCGSLLGQCDSLASLLASIVW